MAVGDVNSPAGMRLRMAAAGPTLDRAVAGLLLIGWAALAWLRWQGHWAPDLSALWFAARAVTEGMPDAVYAAPPGLFDPATPEAWAGMARDAGADNVAIYPYVYPPLWAWLFSGIAGGTAPQGFFDAALAVNILALVAGVWLAGRIARPAFMPWSILALISILLLQTSSISTIALFHNQPQIVVSVLVLWMLERHLAGDGRAAGILLALAAAIKVGPALLVLYLLARRDWRAVAWFTGIGAALGLASIAIAGWPAHATFLARLSQIDGLVALNRVNLAFSVGLHELGGLIGLWPAPFDGPAHPATAARPAAVGWTLRLLLVAGLALLWRARLPGPAAAPVAGELIGNDERARAVAGFLALFILLKLTGPLAWSHHFLPVLLLAPALPGLMPVRRAAALVALLAAGMSQSAFGMLLGLGSSLHLTSIAGAMILSLMAVATALWTRTPGPDPAGSDLGRAIA